jgi:hypothetical protein
MKGLSNAARSMCDMLSLRAKRSNLDERNPEFSSRLPRRRTPRNDSCFGNSLELRPAATHHADSLATTNGLETSHGGDPSLAASGAFVSVRILRFIEL